MPTSTRTSRGRIVRLLSSLSAHPLRLAGAVDLGVHPFGASSLRILVVPLFFIALLFLGCGTLGPALPRTNERSSATPSSSRWIDSTLATLSLRQKVGQMVFVWSSGHYYPTDSDQWQSLERYVKSMGAGGIVISLGDVYEYAVAINKLQKMSNVPLLVASDLEYGLGMRIKSATTFPVAMAIGATRNPDYAYEVGNMTAEEGRAVGICQNYAPVADVNTNPRNPVINTRSFGDDATLVEAMAVQFMKGTQDGNVIATLKHFPGHGDSDIDSHVGLATLAEDTATIHSTELRPFKTAIDAGALSVMVGHIAVPSLDSVSGQPATLSAAITTGVLERELKFNGLVVTDAMRMRAVAGKYASGEAAVRAVKAGVDLLLVPEDPDQAVQAIVEAVGSGEISQKRVDVSVRKLLAMKQWAGLDRQRFVDVDRIADIVGSRKHVLAARNIARDAVTVLGNEDHILPFSHADSRDIIDIGFSDSDDPSVGRSFNELFRQRHPNGGFVLIDTRSSAAEEDSVLARARQAEVILLQLHYYTRSERKTGFLDSSKADFIRKVCSLGKPVVALSFGNPYVVMDIPKPDAYVCAYSDADCTEEAVAEVLFAEMPAHGKLPVRIPGRYAFGEGIAYPKTALCRATPEEAGFDPSLLSAVDTVIERGIADSAFPGGVLLVARNGLVVYNKAYGGLVYGRNHEPVTLNTMYDLASVTKVIATTTAVMRLADEKKIDLRDAVVKYIPQFGQQHKEHITLRDLMVHKSGLPAWRKFYEFCSTPECVIDSLYATRLVYKTGDSTLYSDLGIITMGKIVEKVTGMRLDRYVDSVFFKPLGMAHTMYNPPESFVANIAPTEIDTYWKKTGIAVKGRVHDENAAVLGGISGHAGLFSTASDLAVFMQMLLNGGVYGGERHIHEETVKAFVRRQNDADTRAIGWDTRDSVKSWAGTLMSTRTFLHTGFTGTSVAADPERNLVIILLTNRVYPGRSHTGIAKVRPAVHDAIVKAIVK